MCMWQATYYTDRLQKPDGQKKYKTKESLKVFQFDKSVFSLIRMWPTLFKRSVSRCLVTTTMSSTSKNKSLLDKGAWLASSTPSIRTKVTNKNKKMVIDWDTGCQDTRAILQPEKGKIYDKKPFTMKCEKGKSYLWCTCGWSHTQPFCDSTHKNTHMRIKLYPVRFIAPETKEYTFCNCKQTSKRPFCDGTHLRDDIQAAIK